MFIIVPNVHNVHNQFKMAATNRIESFDLRRYLMLLRFTHGEWLTWPSRTSFTIFCSVENQSGGGKIPIQHRVWVKISVYGKEVRGSETVWSFYGSSLWRNLWRNEDISAKKLSFLVRKRKISMWWWKDFLMKKQNISVWRKGRFQYEERKNSLREMRKNPAEHMGDFSVRKEKNFL